MIYVALYRGRSWFPSRMIRWMTWSPYSHAAIVNELAVGRVIYEAWQGKGVWQHTQWGSGHTPKHTRIDLFALRRPLSEAEEVDLMQEIFRKLGKPYDWRGVLSFLLRRRMQQADAWFCSELVAHCFEKAGRPLVAEKPWKVSPRDLAVSVELKFARSVEI